MRGATSDQRANSVMIDAPYSGWIILQKSHPNMSGRRMGTAALSAILVLLLLPPASSFDLTGRCEPFRYAGYCFGANQGTSSLPSQGVILYPPDMFSRGSVGERHLYPRCSLCKCRKYPQVPRPGDAAVPVFRFGISLRPGIY